MAGLLIVITVSCATTLTSWGIDSRIAEHTDRGIGGAKRRERLAWVAGGRLQLFGMALQGAGSRVWSGELEKTPVRTAANRLERDFEAVIEETRTESWAVWTRLLLRIWHGMGE